MKVLYANPVFLDYRLPFYMELNRLFGGEFHVIYSKQRYQILSREDLYIRIKQELGNNAHPLETDYLFDTHSMSFKMKDIEKGRHIPFTFGLLRKIRKIKPNVIITEGFFQWTPLILLYSIIYKTPVYIGYERTLHTERNVGRLKTWHRKITNRFVSGFLVNGSETKRYLKSIGVDDSKIHVGGMSADAKGLKEELTKMTEEEIKNFKRELSIGSGLVFLFVGRICERKGVTYILKEWVKHIVKHPQDKLILVGTGSQLSQMKAEYSEIESIKFTGAVNYSDIYRFYAVADVFILPTLEDNWSLVVPEAMSCGLPVATSVYNGCHPELVIKDRNGYVFDPLKDGDICNALDYFHKADLNEMGKESVEIEKEFNTENCAQRVFDAIENDITHD